MTVTPVEAPGADFGSPLAVLAGRSARWQRAAGAWVLGTAAWKAAQAARARARTHLQYTVVVDSTDPLYETVAEWVLEQLPPGRRRSLRAVTRGGGETPVDAPTSRRLRFVHDGRRGHVLRVDGHRVTVEVEVDDRPSMKGREFQLRVEKLVFTGNSAAASKAVAEALERLAVSQEERQPRMSVAARWGGWQRLGNVPPRDLDTIALPAGVADDLVADLGLFLASEDAYELLGIPWHRGYVFHGPPGTGKTSLAKALAGRFRMDLHYVPLADLEDDGSLIRLLGEMGPRCLLLLEDIDIVSAATERSDATGKSTLAGLLNALDGVATPHGMVTVMTTNHPDRLDGALLRPGRADRIVELGLLDADQFARLVESVTGTRPTVDRFTPVSPAAVVEAMKQHIGDPRAQLAAAVGVVEEDRMVEAS